MKALANVKDVDAHNLTLFSGIIRRISALGFDCGITYTRDESGLHISAPGIKSEYPVVFKIETE